MSEEQIPQEIREVGERVKSFNEKLLPLLGEYKLGLGAVAFIMPDGRIGARVQVFDDSAPKDETATPEKAEESGLTKSE